MSNDFNRERVLMILGRKETRERLTGMLRIIGLSPSECYVPVTRFSAVRVGAGEKVRSTNRALLWALSGRELPVEGFEGPSCGTKGCCTPDHQKPRAPRPV